MNKEQKELEQKELEQIEVDILLEALYRHYGYDFRNYARASITRRIKEIQKRYNLNCVSELVPKLLYDKNKFKDFVYCLSIPVSEMFRDPEFFLSVRKNVIPYLKTYPHIKIWHAGCASGEEVYSLAILLMEENILKNTTLYATDFNDIALKDAKKGIFPLSEVKKYTENYQNSGGKESFSEYYHAKYNNMIMENELKNNMVFFNHNLTGDEVFSEVHFILCRNVLIYFDRTLQDRVLKLFTNALEPGGILALGSKESLEFTAVSHLYEQIDRKWRIYKKKIR